MISIVITTTTTTNNNTTVIAFTTLWLSFTQKCLWSNIIYYTTASYECACRSAGTIYTVL